MRDTKTIIKILSGTLGVIGAITIILAVAVCGCIVPDNPVTETPTPTETPAATPIATPLATPLVTPDAPHGIAAMIPTANLPGTFELRAIIDEGTTGIDIIGDTLSIVSGNLSIGEIHAVQGIYSFEGGTYDVYVTVIACNDSVAAANAVENYKDRPEFENPPARTVSRFGAVTFNGHEATEVRTRPPTEDGGVRYGYVWSEADYVFILEPGIDDKQASLKLAQMIGNSENAVQEA